MKIKLILIAVVLSTTACGKPKLETKCNGDFCYKNGYIYSELQNKYLEEDYAL